MPFNPIDTTAGAGDTAKAGGDKINASLSEIYSTGRRPWRVFNLDNPVATRRIRAAKSRVMAGVGSATILVHGDSQIAGAGAGDSGDYNLVNAYPKTITAQLVSALSRQGLKAANNSFFGTQSVPNYGTYDGRVVPDGNWTVPNANNLLGGGQWQSSTDGAVFAFTPEGAIDTIQLLTNEHFNGVVSVDGGSVLTPAVADIGNTEHIYTYTVPLGIHTVRCTQSGTDYSYIFGMHCFDSTANYLRTVQAGNFGIQAHTIAQGGAYQRPNNWDYFKADIAGIMLGRNDCSQGFSVDDYRSSMTSIIGKAQQYGDVILITAPPQDVNQGKSLAVQQQYVDVQYDLATSMNCVLLDFDLTFESYAISSALGLYYDDTHQSRAGQRQIAEALSSAIIAA